MPKIRVRPYGNVFRGIYQNSPPPYLPRCQTLPVVFSCLVCWACLSERVCGLIRGVWLNEKPPIGIIEGLIWIDI